MTELTCIAADAIARVLNAIAKERREPSGWEGMHLSNAIGFLAAGNLEGVHHEARRAIARACWSTSPRTSDTPTLAQLRVLLDHVMAQARKG